MCRCEPMLVLGAEPCVSEQAVPHQLMKLLQQLELRAGPCFSGEAISASWAAAASMAALAAFLAALPVGFGARAAAA